MDEAIALILTLVTGLCFIVGIFVAKKNNKKEPLRIFASSLALVVMSGLVIFDLAPELIDIFKNASLWASIITVFCFLSLGFILLKILDKLIPNHQHKHKSNEKNHKEHDSHLVHIGLVTALSLILHNFIEGMALYGTALTSLKAGIIMCISIALHNVPLGMEISLSLEKRISPKKNFILFFTLGIAALLGASILVIIGDINEYILGCIISITCGMLLYIIICELFVELLTYKNKKETKIGLFIGVIIIGISLII